MNTSSRTILLYRWIVFLLAGGFCLYQLGFGNWNGPGGPFRYLTIWALFISFYVATRLLAVSAGYAKVRLDIAIMCASVLNIMVVFLYWRLFFIDPSLVNGENDRNWMLEYYLHLLGPVLQVIDALFIAKLYKRAWRAAPMLLAIIAAYIAWSELFVQRFNSEPVGSVTSGLPYPFLNSMEWPERATFYGGNGLIAVLVLLTPGFLAATLRSISDRYRVGSKP